MLMGPSPSQLSPLALSVGYSAFLSLVDVRTDLGSFAALWYTPPAGVVPRSALAHGFPSGANHPQYVGQPAGLLSAVPVLFRLGSCFDATLPWRPIQAGLDKYAGSSDQQFVPLSILGAPVPYDLGRP